MATKPNVTEISTVEERLLKASIEQVQQKKQQASMRPLAPGEAEKLVGMVDANERLNSQLAGIAAASGASMLPQEVAPPPPKEELPDLKDLITDVKDRLNMIRMLETDVEWAAKEKEAKAARKPLVSRMKEILGRYRVGKCGWNEYTVNYYGSERPSIKKEALVLALVGVGLQPNVIQSVIQAATVTTTAYTLRITQPGEKEEKGEAE